MIVSLLVLERRTGTNEEVKMDSTELRDLLDSVAAGSVDVEEAVHKLRVQPFVDLGYAKPDTHRGIRTGVSEVIYGASKTAQQMCGISKAMLEAGQNRILITRLDPPKAEVIGEFLQKENVSFAYHEIPRVGIVGGVPEPTGNGTVVVCAAGTSDLYAAEEAALTAEMLGSRVNRLYDVGVAGIHRLLGYVDEFADASAIVAVAGMEGALASVVGGLADCPVVAVPTSVGYGASFGGVAALLSMLNSCASGVSVVNIDNGFGAGYQAALIDHAIVRVSAQNAQEG